MLKETPFTATHIALGAKMADFAGFNMPIQYPTGINREHIIVREGVGVFDVSHMGEFWVKGERALDFLQYITTNDVSKLDAGKAQYTCMPNGKGGIVDDLIIYKYSTTKYLLVVNAGNIDKDWEWVNKQNTFGVSLENASDRYGQLAVQGPKATELLQLLTDADLSAIPYYSFREWSFAGVQGVIQAIRALVDLSCIFPKSMANRYGTPFSRWESSLAWLLSAWAHAIVCVSRSGIASTGMILTTPHRPLRQVSAGLPNLMRKISSTKTSFSSKRQRA